MESILVRDYMNRRPVHFSPDETIIEAVERLLASGLTGGPVVDAEKRLVGFLSEQDCLGKGLEASYHCESMAMVKELMKTNVLTVKPEDSVLELAAQMLGQKPKIYPVIDENGVMLGVITRRDVLRALEAQMRTCYRMPA